MTTYDRFDYRTPDPGLPQVYDNAPVPRIVDKDGRPLVRKRRIGFQPRGAGDAAVSKATPATSPASR